MPDQFEQQVMAFGGRLPREWEWYRAQYGDVQKAICCGIFGGNRIDFINYYADTAIQLLEREENAPILGRMSLKEQHVVLLEQFLLAACIEYHRGPYSRFGRLEAEYLFHCMDDAYHCARVIGFTHLIGDAKNNPMVARCLEERVQAVSPELYARALRFLKDKNGKLPAALAPLHQRRDRTRKSAASIAFGQSTRRSGTVEPSRVMMVFRTELNPFGPDLSSRNKLCITVRLDKLCEIMRNTK
jgi:hypothetical protein